MATITTDMANAWVDKSKLTIPAIDSMLESQIVAQVFSKLGVKYDTTLWTSTENTPSLVQSVVSMIYAGMTYIQAFAIDYTSNSSDLYGNQLIADANKIIDSVVSGQVALLDSRQTVSINSLTDYNFSPVVATELISSEPKFSMDTDW